MRSQVYAFASSEQTIDFNCRFARNSAVFNVLLFLADWLLLIAYFELPSPYLRTA
jgi:hypothetical protein